MTATARRLNFHSPNRHERLLKRMHDRVKANERAGIVTDLSRRDYRWWQAIKAGIPVNRADCLNFWCRLHWQTREKYINQHILLTVSEQDRNSCAEESKKFFCKALNNPRLDKERQRKCDILRIR